MEENENLKRKLKEYEERESIRQRTGQVVDTEKRYNWWHQLGMTGPQACTPSNHPSASNTTIKIPKRLIEADVSKKVG
jgi:hypothetical protein